MVCVEIVVGNYTNKQGEIAQKVVAKFDSGQEFMFSMTPEQVKQQLQSGKTKGDVVVIDGQYGKYAGFTALTDIEVLA